MVIRRTLSTQQVKENDLEQQQENIFHARAIIHGKGCSLIIDGGSCINVVSNNLVDILKLPIMRHLKPYMLQWINGSGEVKVNRQVLLSFTLGNYQDQVLCDVVPMNASHILLGRP